MTSIRVLGNNIRLLLNENGTSIEKFANALNYSCFDVKKLLDGRLLTTQGDINDIANYFNIPIEELLICKDESLYKGKGSMVCTSNFKCPENKEKVLDILDMYCGLKEALGS